MPMKLDSRQTRQRSKLDQLSTTTDLRLDAIMNLINDELTMPLRMRANLGAGTDGTPNQNLYIDSIFVKTLDTGVADSGHERSRTIPPINGTLPNYTGSGYIAFPTTSGGSITGTGLTLDKAYTLTLASGEYVKILVWLNSSSQFGMEIGTPAASEALAALPASPTDAFVLGYIVMNNTAGTISKVLNENVYQFVGGGSSGGGGSGASKEITQANSFVVGDVVYYNGSSYAKAQANVSSTAEAIGVVSKASATKFTVTELGHITGLSGLTAGTVYYLSDATAGLLTATEPTTLGSVSKPMLIADSTTSGYVLNYRGAVVGGTNARTELSLSNIITAQNIQSVTAYEAGELAGWVYINATTSYRFYVAVQFAKNGAGTDYNLSYQTSGEVPPTGFSMSVTSGGMIQLTLASSTLSGFVSAKLNYSLNAPAVGATFPLSIDASTITTGTVSSARLPAGQYPGSTSGSDIAAGYVGENTLANTASVSISSTTNFVNLQTISLNKGIYLLTSMIDMDNAASCTGHTQAISINTGNTTTDHVRGLNQVVVSTAANTSTTSCISNYYLKVTSDSTTIYQKAKASGATTTCAASLRAIRIA